MPEERDEALLNNENENDPLSKAAQLRAVAERAAVCTACDLALTRTQVVFGDGSPEAPLMLVGEAPGMHEDATGKPFVGRAGMLLDACLRENGITRKHIYITNIVRCRPFTTESGSARNRPPTQEEISACRPWLEETIAIIRPLVILCLGAPAASVLIHKGFKMSQERGQWVESRYSRYIAATWHPAYILRLQGDAYETARRELIADIAAARQKVIEAKREPKLTLF